MGAHSFEDLIPHLGHDIVCVSYGKTHHASDRSESTIISLSNAALECETCNEVLLDFDKIRDLDQEFEHEIMTFVTECDNKDLLTHIAKMVLRRIDEL